MNQLTIRGARREDAEMILRVHREAILAKAATHYDSSQLEGWGVGPTPERVIRMQKEIADPDFIVLVAEAEGVVVGFGCVQISTQQLRTLYVKPNAMGRVGHRLLEELEAAALTVTTALSCDASLNAVEFYKAHGYLEHDSANHLLSSGVTIPCVKMTKKFARE